jgi:hypothetical protein
MSNYVQSTNFATKDALSSGDPLKIVKGTEINTEFANIAIAVATKADLASPTFTGTPLAPTASTSTDNTQIATTAFVQAAALAALQVLHPVGSVYINASNAGNPGTLFGFGTWEVFGAGRVLVGQDVASILFLNAGTTGGSADAIAVSHTHTATSVVTDAGHSHSLTVGLVPESGGGWFAGGSGTPGDDGTATTTTATTTTGVTVATTVASSGSSGTNANYQPYIVVYMWKRTA